MRTTTSLFLLTLLLFSFSLQAYDFQIDEYPISDIPDELKENADAVLRLSSEQFRIENPGKGIFTGTYVMSILNEDAAEKAVAYVFYDGKLITGNLLSAEIYDASGKRVKKVKNKDFHDQSANSSGTFVGDNRIQYAELNHDVYPYTIVFSYQQKFNGLFALPSFNPLDDEKLSVQKAEFEVICDPDYDLRYKKNNYDGEENIFLGSDSKRHYVWTLQNLKPTKREAFAPPFARLTPSVQLAPSEFEIEGYEGIMNDWTGFGQFIYDLNQNRDGLPKNLASQVMQLTADAQNDQEKIAAIYQYLQQNTRYVGIQLGIGGYQTFPAEYVYENGYGDCKALSNYMKGMLNHIGISSHLAIIYRGDNPPPIDPSFAVNSFNHMILCVPLEGDTMWLECTNNNSLAGYLDESTADRYAVLATPSGGKLVRTPARTPQQNARIRTAEIQLRPDGHAEVRSIQQYSGYMQDRWEDVIGSLSAREQEKYLRRTIAPGSYDLEDYKMYRDSTSTEPICFTEYDLFVKNCASASSSRLFLAPNALSNKISVPEKMTNRSQPIHFNAPYFLKDSLNFKLPAGYIVESLPELPITIDTEFGSYKANIHIPMEGEVIYTRELMFKKTDKPAEAYDDFRNFYRKVSKADKLQLVLTNKS